MTPPTFSTETYNTRVGIYGNYFVDFTVLDYGGWRFGPKACRPVHSNFL